MVRPRKRTAPVTEPAGTGWRAAGSPAVTTVTPGGGGVVVTGPGDVPIGGATVIGGAVPGTGVPASGGAGVDVAGEGTVVPSGPPMTVGADGSEGEAGATTVTGGT